MVCPSYMITYDPPLCTGPHFSQRIGWRVLIICIPCLFLSSSFSMWPPSMIHWASFPLGTKQSCLKDQWCSHCSAQFVYKHRRSSLPMPWWEGSLWVLSLCLFTWANKPEIKVKHLDWLCMSNLEKTKHKLLKVFSNLHIQSTADHVIRKYVLMYMHKMVK